MSLESSLTRPGWKHTFTFDDWVASVQMSKKREENTWADFDEQVFFKQPIDGAVTQDSDKTDSKLKITYLYSLQFQTFDWSNGLISWIESIILWHSFIQIG